MDSYRLPGVRFSVEGPESKVQTIINAMFQLCPRDGGTPDVKLTSRLVSESRLADAIPEWIAREIAAGRVASDPIMVMGPAGEPAALSRTPNSVGCAWLNENADTIHFVASMANPPETNRPGHLERPVLPRSTLYTGPVALSIQTVLMPVLREVFLRRNRILIHSAAVVYPDDTGVLFVANGGGGKTTTALSVLRKGARLLGDDLIVIQADGVNIRAFGIPEPMNLTDDTIGFFEELRAAADSIPGRPDFHKKTVAPRQIYGPACMAEQCTVRVIYFVRVNPEGPAVRPLSAPDALSRLFQAHRFAAQQKIDARAFEQLSNVVTHARVYELNTGHAPDALGVWLTSNSAVHAAH
jgi:hypothetical protein